MGRKFDASCPRRFPDGGQAQYSFRRLQCHDVNESETVWAAQMTLDDVSIWF
jgi:hypothetical protein